MNSETGTLKSTGNLASAIGAVGKAYIFIYLNINLGTLDILPDWVGYLFILSAIPTLSLWEESMGLLRNIGFLLAIFGMFLNQLTHFFPIRLLLCSTQNQYC